MKKLEYYTIRPSLKQFYGIKVDEKTNFDDNNSNEKFSNYGYKLMNSNPDEPKKGK